MGSKIATTLIILSFWVFFFLGVSAIAPVFARSSTASHSYSHSYSRSYSSSRASRSSYGSTSKPKVSIKANPKSQTAGASGTQKKVSPVKSKPAPKPKAVSKSVTKKVSKSTTVINHRVYHVYGGYVDPYGYGYMHPYYWSMFGYHPLGFWHPWSGYYWYNPWTWGGQCYFRWWLPASWLCPHEQNQ